MIVMEHLDGQPLSKLLDDGPLAPTRVTAILREVALGIHDDKRMADDYALVKDYIGIDKPFDVKSTYTNEFLDKSIKMKAAMLERSR